MLRFGVIKADKIHIVTAVQVGEGGPYGTAVGLAVCHMRIPTKKEIRVE
jgi:hypothetical protein